jgi:hypothetical protein
MGNPGEWGGIAGVLIVTPSDSVIGERGSGYSPPVKKPLKENGIKLYKNDIRIMQSERITLSKKEIIAIFSYGEGFFVIVISFYIFYYIQNRTFIQFT